MDISELVKRQAMRRGLSAKTIKTYNQCLMQFFRHCKKDPNKIKKKDIEDYLDMLIDKNKTGNTINVSLNALKFFYSNILNKKLATKIRFSKTPKNMPVVLTKDETKKLIESVKNQKHSLMLKMMYSAGLRLSELVNLKVKDLELSKNYGWVRKGKGNKDRLFIIAESIKQELLDYIGQENLNQESWIFNGYNGHISIRTVQVVIKEAAKKAKINKNIHPHTLRHSFATHLIENGYDVTSVQSLLGHNNPNTTMLYVHMASPTLLNIRSPLDDLNLNNKDNKNKNTNNNSIITMKKQVMGNKKHSSQGSEQQN